LGHDLAEAIRAGRLSPAPRARHTRQPGEISPGTSGEYPIGRYNNNAIEGIKPSPELAALCEMFLQERAPLPVSEPFVDRFFRE
jgi:hypothetical protein